MPQDDEMSTEIQTPSSDDDALIELARRILVPRVLNDRRLQGRLRNMEPNSPLMEILTEVARRKKIPPQMKVRFRKLKRRYRGKDDRQLLMKAKQGGDIGQRGVQMMRRLIKRQGGDDEQGNLGRQSGQRS